ncbi:MAG: CBS domain-containing protein [Candidatus Rokubacteria bacterium]|nr:CBS domain-containing protein [Candidatus Rokubacteria bacterium]
MRVRDIMQPRVVTITPKTTLPEAVRLAAERRIRHLPVVDAGDLVGIVSDRDLKRAMASPATSLEAHELNYLLNRLTVAEIMTSPVITIGPTFPAEEAARLMAQERIGALPVTEADRLIGIVTETDVLELFVRVMGAGAPSVRLEVLLGEGPPALSDLVTTVESAGAPVSSIVILTSPARLREALIRVATIDPEPAIRALETRGYAVRTPWRG